MMGGPSRERKVSERDKILSACGWFVALELPLIAERIVNHSAEKIERLQAQVYESEVALKSISRGTADYWSVVRTAAKALAKLKALEGEGND